MLCRIALALLLLGLIPLASAQTPPPAQIVFTTPSEDTQGSIRTLVERFNRMQKRIKVKYCPLSSSSDAIHDTYVTAFLAKDPSFDVIAADVVWSPEFAAARWVESLDACLSRTEAAKFLPMALQTCTYQNRLWGIPWFTDTGLLFYRKDLVSQPPCTWAELMKLSKARIKAGTIPYGYVFQGNQYEGLVCNTLEFIWGNGGAMLTNGQVQISSAQSIEALQFMAELVKSRIAPPRVTEFQEEDARLFFQDGKALFLRHWPNAWASVNSPASRIKGKVGIAALPAGPSGKQGAGCLGGWNLMINRYSRNKPAAWQFIAFMTSVAGQQQNAAISGRLPTRYAVYHDPLVLRKNPYYTQFLPLILRSKPRPISTVYPALSGVMQNYFSQALTGQLSPAAAIRSIETEMRVILEH